MFNIIKMGKSEYQEKPNRHSVKPQPFTQTKRKKERRQIYLKDTTNENERTYVF